MNLHAYELSLGMHCSQYRLLSLESEEVQHVSWLTHQTWVVMSVAAGV